MTRSDGTVQPLFGSFHCFCRQQKNNNTKNTITHSLNLSTTASSQFQLQHSSHFRRRLNSLIHVLQFVWRPCSISLNFSLYEPLTTMKAASGDMTNGTLRQTTKRMLSSTTSMKSHGNFAKGTQLLFFISAAPPTGCPVHAVSTFYPGNHAASCPGLPLPSPPVTRQGLKSEDEGFYSPSPSTPINNSTPYEHFLTFPEALKHSAAPRRLPGEGFISSSHPT